MAKIQKGDTVLIIAGKDKHKTGLVERVFPKKNKIVVSGLNIVKKHLKKSTKNPQGGIIDRAMPIDISNAMLLDPVSGKPTRIGYAKIAESKQRIARVSNQSLLKTESQSR